METVNFRRFPSWWSFPARRSVLKSNTTPASNTYMFGYGCNFLPKSGAFLVKFNLASSRTFRPEYDCNVIPASMPEYDCNVIPASMPEYDCNVIPKSGTLMIEYDRAHIFLNFPSQCPKGHSVGNKEVTNSETRKKAEYRGCRYNGKKREAVSLWVVFVITFEGESTNVRSLQGSMVLVIITFVCEEAVSRLTQPNCDSLKLFKSDYRNKRRATVQPHGRKHENVSHSYEDRTTKPDRKYQRSVNYTVANMLGNQIVFSLHRNLKSKISILQKITKCSFVFNSVAGESYALVSSPCRVEHSHNINGDSDDENDVPRSSCLLDISYYQLEHDHDNNNNNNGDDEYEDDVTPGSCRLDIFHCHLEQTCYDNEHKDNDNEYAVADGSCLLDTSHLMEQGQDDNNNSGIDEDDCSRNPKSGHENAVNNDNPNGYTKRDDLEYPIVLNASSRVYDLSSASGRNMRKSRENKSIFTPSSSKSDLSDDEDRSNLVYAHNTDHSSLFSDDCLNFEFVHNTDNSQITNNSSLFNEDCFSKIMTNAGLSDDDLNRFLESETEIDCVLFRSQIFGGLLADECVLTTSSEDTFIDIDKTMQCGSEGSDSSIFQSELTEQLPACYSSHLNKTGRAYAGCSYVASTSYYATSSMSDDCDYLSLTGSTENGEFSRCTSRLIDSTNANFPSKQSTSTVVSYEDSQLLEYSLPAACVHSTVGSVTGNICGFTINENNPNQSMTETMAYQRDENETSADYRHEVYGQTSRVTGNLWSQTQPTVGVPLMNYSDNLSVATSHGGHLSGHLGAQSESANIQQEVSTDGDASAALVLQCALPVGRLTRSNKKRKRAPLTRSMLNSGLVVEKLDIASNSDKDEILEPVHKRRCSIRLLLFKAGKQLT